MAHTDKRTAIVFDRHPMWLDAVRRLLQRSEIQVLAVSTTIVDVLDLVREHRPDLLFVDAELGRNVLQTIEWILLARAAVPALAVVVFAPEGRTDVVVAALHAGAASVVLKSTDLIDLLAVTRQTASRSIYTAVPLSESPSLRAGSYPEE